MATYYVDDDGSNTDPYDTLAKAATTLDGLLTAKALANLDVVRIRSTHVENVGSIVINEGVTGANVVSIISINAADQYESMATGGGVLDTNAGVIEIYDNVRMYGLKFEANSIFGPGRGGTATQEFHDCDISQKSAVNQHLYLSRLGGGNVIRFKDCRFQFATAAGTTRQLVVSGAGAVVEMHGCTVNAANQTAASAVIDCTDNGQELILDGCDLSNVGVNPLVATLTSNQRVTISRCRLKSGYTATPTIDRLGGWVLVEDSHSGVITAPEFGVRRFRRLVGDVTHETTSVRTGGASNHGVTYSHKYVTNANALELYRGLQGTPVVIPVAAGSQTLTVHCAGAVDLDNDELWIEVLSPNEEASETAQYKWRTTRANPLATPVALTRDSTAVWGGADTGTDGGAGQQKIDVSINPAQAGKVIVRAFLAKPSTTHYVCPLIELT